MCLGGADFQTSSGNLTGFGSLGTTVQSTATNQIAGGLGFGETYALSSAFSGLTKGLAAFKTASAQKQSMMLEAQVQQANAQMIAEQIKNEKSTAKKQRDAIRRKYKRVKQSIAPAAAANNLLLGGGSPLDALLGAEIYGTADLGTAKVNEANRVFGMQIQKFNADARADIAKSSAARISPFGDAVTTMLSSATSNAFNYYNYKQSRITGLSTVQSALGIP